MLKKRQRQREARDAYGAEDAAAASSARTVRRGSACPTRRWRRGHAKFNEERKLCAETRHRRTGGHPASADSECKRKSSPCEQGSRMKVADESQALRLVIQTQQDGRRRSTSPLACGSDQKEEQDGHRRTPSPVACDSDQRQDRRSQTNPKPSGLWFRPAAQTPEPRGSWSRRRHNQGADHHLAACSCAR